jgi:isoleucyl-tRNA synthetase
MSVPQPMAIDLKKTVHLPQTDFPMKADLAQREPKMLDHWRAIGLYEQIRAARAGSPRYVLHDGPPYANGNIHLGHAFNKLLKDFIVKFKTMTGFDSPYVPGWDCHGLPIEIKVDGQLGEKKAKMTVAQIRRACRKYAEGWVEKQSKDFQRLGVFGEWDNPYLTMSASYEAVIARSFLQILERGFVYKGLKPVNWCIHDGTALAEAEVEYETHVSPSVWVAFPLASDAAALDPELAGKPVAALIWTTTPWTLPANLGISFNPRFEYAAVEANGRVFLVAEDLMQATAHAANWHPYTVLTTFPGSRLDRAVFRHPFLDRESLGMAGDHVTLEQGTGAVHTAPGHGQDDYVIGQRYGLPTYCPVDGQGRMFAAPGAPGELPAELLGKTIWEANPLVIRILEERGALIARQDLHHSYPHCWRCHNPTIFRATEQWFIGMDRNGLRQNTLEAIRRVKWMPAWGEDRISNMIATRPDWCISRQRVWGVPIVAFYCQDCQEPLQDLAPLHRIVDQFAQHTADFWYERSAAELLGPDMACSCGSRSFRKESDILDVWFDSGASHLAVLTPERGLPWPSQMYLEGGDQYRGWFHSSLLLGVALQGGSPYEGCATNGWTLDGDGRAMSKSLGNVIEPAQIIKHHGAEVLRLWVASVEFNEDVRISDTIVTRLTEAYRKLRNTLRYALGNLDAFDPERDAVPAAELFEIDRWILARTAELARHSVRLYEELAFHRVYRAIYDFAAVDLSAVYFDVLKDRLYTSAPGSKARRSAQTALFVVTHALVRLLAPILAFTAEEVWQHLPKRPDDPESVHLARMPVEGEITAGLDEPSLAPLVHWPELLAVRDVVLKSLEAARESKRITASLQAVVTLDVPDAMFPLLTAYQALLPSLFIVSEVRLRPGTDLTVAIDRSTEPKCERCWKFLPSVGADPVFPLVCSSCSEALHTMFPEATA